MSVPPSKLTKLYYLTRVMSLSCHVPYTSLGILNITLVTGNDVNMDMEDTLLGRRPHVYADIVTAGVELRVQQAALLGDQLHAGPDLFRQSWRHDDA